ncbi:hypothetical protein M9H77_08991 [Catharanthus roseus]|uniref:Uncharacterized protein n=1 Tax=Catharanthus roseus TaxID=4058 RepID=A0ACC0BZR4_CATRO|nr:hypothetical protein M9H77_08991 [Catharanthus roseus]
MGNSIYTNTNQQFFLQTPPLAMSNDYHRDKDSENNAKAVNVLEFTALSAATLLSEYRGRFSDAQPNLNVEKVRAYTVVKYTLENLKHLQGYPYTFMHSQRDKRELSSLEKDLNMLQSFLQWMQENSIQHSTATAIVMDSVSLVGKILDSTDSYICDYIIRKEKSFNPSRFLKYSAQATFLTRFAEKMITDMNTDGEDRGFPLARLFEKLYPNMSNDGGLVTEGSDSKESMNSSSHETCSSQRPSLVGDEQIVIGFKDDTKELLDRLIGGWKQLEVISVTGMAGIGKTTLASKLYNNIQIVGHFHIRAWTSVSQSYQKRKLLHKILSSIINEKDPVFTMSDEDIGDRLYKCLKKKRYLIVIDDIWDMEAWNDLKIHFPEDEEYSRILITSRVENVALNIIRSNSISSNSGPHQLKLLSGEESWDLFQRNVFGNNGFPEYLINVGLEVVAKCKGLPLAIVVIAGLLAQGEKTEIWWRHVANNIGSFVNSNSKELENTLALSYIHLPSHLKSCFLYLGSFPEDYEIPARMLIRSWIAEGFISSKSEKRLEDVAQEHLTNLVSRNLLMVAKRRSNGGIKSCKMHDLLRDLCLQKAPEKTFLQPLCKCRPGSSSSSSNPDEAGKFSNCQYLHFLGSYYVDQGNVFNETTLSLYKLLRTLDLRYIILNIFPESVTTLIHLKYLALCVDHIEELPNSIFELWRLETFILDSEKSRRVILNTDVMKMVGLRHLEISQELVCQEGWKSFFVGAKFSNLHTISRLCPLNSFKNFLSRAPNLRKLGLYLSYSERDDPFTFPNLAFLDQLEVLKFEYRTLGMMPFNISHLNIFPSSLKRLTLIGSYANWEEMSILGKLPNLEVLRIKDNFFSGSKWETRDDGFRRLKFLKLSHVDLKQWISESSHFPILERLVLNGCSDLEKIPIEMGEIDTLQKIDVYKSSSSVVESARDIQEARKELGNEEFNVFIYEDFQEF